MTRLSENSFIVSSHQGESSEKFIPFTVYARIVPNLANGRRFDNVRGAEKLADQIEDDLEAAGMTDKSEGDAGTNTSGINVAYPVAWTPQFGNFPARVTITGFITSSTPNVSPVTSRSFIANTGGAATGVVTGPSISPILERGDTTTAADDKVAELKLELETASSLLDIFKIEINGVLYGEGGRSFL